MYGIKEKAKYALAAVTPAVVSGALAITSYASEGGGDAGVMETVTTNLITSVTEMASSIGSAVGQVIPLALPVIGAALIVSIGIKVFKSVTNKA